ncbi:hypothetical protein KAW08_03650 [bacterium]|nr:hypothetical protein [bacterium]
MKKEIRLSMIRKNELQVDCSFPGGNIVVEKIQDDEIFVHRSFTSWGHFHHWSFRVRGAEGRELTFHFSDGNKIGVRGPAISRDSGRTWRWLCRLCRPTRSFAYSFAANEHDIRFSVGMQYQEKHLTSFLQQFSHNSQLRVKQLCETNKKRPVERLHLGCIAEAADYRVLLTCRHHAEEAMANYALEGIMEVILGNSDAGEWFARHVEFLLIPFMDKDGVEASFHGEEINKHNCNTGYAGKNPYPSVAALQAFVPDWSAGKLVFALDLHGSALHGAFHEVLMSPERLRDKGNWQRTEVYLKILESVQCGPLVFKLDDSLRFTTWDGSGRVGPNLGSFATWVRTLPKVQFASVIEIPFANAGGNEVNQNTTRAFGRDLANAMHVFLQRLTS